MSAACLVTYLCLFEKRVVFIWSICRRSCAVCSCLDKTRQLLSRLLLHLRLVRSTQIFSFKHNKNNQVFASLKPLSTKLLTSGEHLFLLLSPVLRNFIVRYVDKNYGIQVRIQKPCIRILKEIAIKIRLVGNWTTLYIFLKFHENPLITCWDSSSGSGSGWYQWEPSSV